MPLKSHLQISLHSHYPEVTVGNIISITTITSITLVSPDAAEKLLVTVYNEF
jgi:hypothetical protein